MEESYEDRRFLSKEWLCKQIDQVLLKPLIKVRYSLAESCPISENESAFHFVMLSYKKRNLCFGSFLNKTSANW